MSEADSKIGRGIEDATEENGEDGESGFGWHANEPGCPVASHAVDGASGFVGSFGDAEAKHVPGVDEDAGVEFGGVCEDGAGARFVEV